MKTSEIKKYLEIYYKRMRKETRRVQQREIKLLWQAIKAKIRKDQEAKGIKLKTKPKKVKEVKKLSYDTED